MITNLYVRHFPKIFSLGRQTNYWAITGMILQKKLRLILNVDIISIRDGLKQNRKTQVIFIRLPASVKTCSVLFITVRYGSRNDSATSKV